MEVTYISKIKSPSYNYILLLTSGFSLALLTARILHSGSLHYLFLAWNLFLAFIPFWISSFLLKTKTTKWYFLIPAGFLWLLFLPNAPYIITDFFHLEQKTGVPIWFDLILIQSFAWSGLLFWVLSMFHFKFLLENKINPNLLKTSMLLLIFLSALGVYMGRYGRWNSWDFFTKPLEIISQVFYMIIHPFSFPGFYGMILSIALFLFLFYSIFEKLTGSRINEINI